MSTMTPPLRPVANPFIIIQGGSEKADPATRRLIRSHVRKNENRGRARTRTGHGLYADAANGRRRAPWPTTEAKNGGSSLVEEAIKPYAPQIPSRVGGDLSFVGVADEIESSILLNIVKVTPAALRLIFPLKAAMGFQVDGETRLYPIARDPVALHITAYAIEGLIDIVLRRRESTNPRGMLHLQKGLALLRDRLSGKDLAARTSDATIGVVLKLASAACFEGDYPAARRHLRGVLQMVDLRGGLDQLRRRELLVEEILRYDLCVSLLGGLETLFYSSLSEWPPEFPQTLLPSLHVASAEALSPTVVELELVGGSMDEDLATCWRAMRRFCLLTNLLGTQTQRTVRWDFIHQTTAATMYRLLRMRFSPGSGNEAVRLGMLAFSHHVFLQWEDIKPPRAQFAAAYRETIQRVDDVGGDLGDLGSPQLMLWLAMVGAISLFDASSEVWLRERLQLYAHRCRVGRWREVRRILRSLLWIDLLDDERGEYIFNNIN